MNNKIIKNKRAKGTIAITQILILVISIIAISWMVGSEIEEVSAADPGASCSLTHCVGTMIYGSKRDSSTGLCVEDNSPSGFKENCQYGCSAGICKTKWQTNSITDKVATITTPIAATKEAIELAKWTGTKLGIIKPAAIVGASTTTTVTPGIVGASLPGGSAGGAGMYSVPILGPILNIVGWSAVAFLVGRYMGPLLGLNTQQSQSLGYGLAVGTATMLTLGYTGVTSSLAGVLGIGAGTGAVGGPVGIAIGVIVAFTAFAILGKKSSSDVIQYGCSQWEAQSGRGLTETQMTQRCKICNDQKDLVCTEYQCRSLGQGCVLINEENSGKQLCIWNNTRDIASPIIKPWNEALLEDFKYTPDNAISPPDRGVKITYTGSELVTSNGTMRCAPAFTPISFGVELNEPARCKISPLKIASYAEMADIFMGRGIREYNQSFVLSLPSREAMEAENITVDNGGNYGLYVRCEDANGNSNPANFVFKFCINQGPDTTPPEILGTSIPNNSPFTSGQKFMNIELYVRDQTFTKANATCRWSYLDKSYSSMEGNINCSHTLLNLNAQMAYTCRANLTGLKDNQNNKFYFRCIDDLGNANSVSFPLTLTGTQPLIIDEVGPTGIIEDSTNTIKINLTAQTSAGNDEGKAICAFSETGRAGSYVDFFYGNDVEPFSQYQHLQELYLEEGNYTYFIQCRDKGGNMDEASANFSVKTDTSAPIVVRVYKEDASLKLITNEPGRCVYDTINCNYLFNDGTEMTSLSDKEYYAEWNLNTDFYIKCEDKYGNKPLPNQCSIIARPFEIFALQ
jgi:hypothetical protein